MLFCTRRIAAISCTRCGPDLAAHIKNVILHQDNTPYHTTRSTLLEIDVLGVKRPIHQPYSKDLVPLECVYFPNLKTYLWATRFIYRTKISHSIQKCNRSLNRAWFMNVYQTYGKSHHKCNIHQGVYFNKWVVCDVLLTITAAVVTPACAAPVYMVLLYVL